MDNPNTSDARSTPSPTERDNMPGGSPPPSDEQVDSEQAAGNLNAAAAGEDEPRRRAEMRAAALAQRAEMEKYQWCLGVQLGRDPRLDRTQDEIFAEWIARHAAAFRAWWEANRRTSDG